MTKLYTFQAMNFPICRCSAQFIAGLAVKLKKKKLEKSNISITRWICNDDSFWIATVIQELYF